MGRKRTWAGEFFLLCSAGLILVTISSCANFLKPALTVNPEPCQEKAAAPEPVCPPPEQQAKVEGTEGRAKEAARVEEAVPRPEAMESAAEKSKKGEEAGKAEKENPVLLRARKSFDRGDYAASQKENLKVLSFTAKNAPKDQALFNLGLIYAHTENPQRDTGKALFYFKKLMKDFPQSPLAGEARVWTGVLEENGKLAYIIEEFKKVDRDVEEKKREKAR